MRLLAGVLVVALWLVDACGARGIAGGGVAGSGRTPGGSPSGKTVLQSLAALLLWIQITQATILSTRMAAFTYIIGLMVDDLT